MEISLETGDLVLFYSDGITDLLTPDGGRLGTSGFAEWVGPRAHLALNDLTGELARLRSESPEGSSVRDDFTCVAVRFVGQEIPSERGLSLWAHVGALRKVRDYVASVAETVGFTRQELGEVQLAVQEASSNAVRHARPGHSAVPLEVLAEKVGNKLRITLRYPGGPFDLGNVPAPSLDGSRDGGFGIAIMRQCMDQIEYRSDGDENILYMKKAVKVPDASAPSS
jgi:anti-sigma regulatory factor (Ser/Thr protein kinase)